jgi:hypothetical protein
VLHIDVVRVLERASSVEQKATTGGGGGNAAGAAYDFAGPSTSSRQLRH